MDDRIVALAKERYISLTTYRRDGRAVATPVWFALEGTGILMWTYASSGKVKRIRANGRASVAPCDARGRTKGAAFDARARILPDSDVARVERILSSRYRFQKPILDVLTMLQRKLLRKPRGLKAYIELSLPDDSHSAPGAS